MSTDIHALSGAYAVDALDPRERADFERHLAGCESCQAEVAGLREAATFLSEPTATAPRPELRAQILGGIDQIRPLPPRIGAVTPARSRRWTTTALLVAASIAFAMAFWRPWQAQAPSPVQLSAVAQIQHAPDAKVVRQEFTGGTSLTWYRSAALDRVAVVAQGLPALSGGKVYELWLRDSGGRMNPAGYLPAGADAAAALDGAAGSATGAGITVEPAGGSAHPTSTPLGVVAFVQS